MAQTPDTNPHADLVAALGALSNIHKTGDVQDEQRRYRYVELDELLDAARPILLAHRLVLTQDIATDDTGALAVTTILWHASGERFTFGPLRSHQPDAPQALGSIITYWRRYAAMAALGVAGADDDAQTAQNATRTPRRSPQQDREQYGQTLPVERAQARPDDPANDPYQTRQPGPPARPQAMDERDRPLFDPFDPERPASRGSVGKMHVVLKDAGHTTDEQKRAAVARLFNLDPGYEWSSGAMSQRAVNAVIDWYQNPPQEAPDAG